MSFQRLLARRFPAFPSRTLSTSKNAFPNLDGKLVLNTDDAKLYAVPRNSQGSLPVYSDVRNGGPRYLVLVRNVKGNVNALRDDLTSSLFQPGSPEAARLKIAIPRSDTLVLSGGRWKHRIMDWLRLNGF